MQLSHSARAGTLGLALLGLMSVGLAQSKSHTIKLPKKGIEIIIRELPNSTAQGTWRLQSASRDLASTKLIFGKDGRFRFIGSSWKSSGYYEQRGERLTLTWTEIDGERVDDQGFRKDLYLNGNWLQIDRYTYRKD